MDHAGKKKECKIIITKGGPYIVTGNVPLFEKINISNGLVQELKEGRKLPQSEEYTLCRCGRSKNAPFCDGSHMRAGFTGDETASKIKYEDRAELIEGSNIDLMDDQRCAYTRFCHRKNGNAWELTINSDNEENRREAIQAACNCPAGRLVAVEKTGQKIENVYDPSIEIVQDPEKGVSAGIFVKGNITIESSDGQTYEARNRAALCRCGESGNKPFCDATHVSIDYRDNR